MNNPKQSFLFLLLDLFLIILTAQLVIFCNSCSRELADLSALPTDIASHTYTLRDGLLQDNSITYCFTGSIEQEPCLLIQSASPSFPYALLHDEETLFTHSASSISCIYPLSNGFYHEKEGAYRFTIQFHEDTPNLTDVVITLATQEKLQEVYLISIFCHVFILGILFLMAAQAFLLYTRKPNESYLLRFAVYCAVLFLWGSSKINLGFNAPLTILSDRYTKVLVAFNLSISVSTCFRTFEVRLPGKKDLLSRWYILFGVSLFLRLVVDFFPITGTIRLCLAELPWSLLELFALLGLLFGDTADRGGARLVAASLSVSWGMRLLVTLQRVFLIRPGLMFLTLRLSRLVDLPLAIGFFLIINRRFASKFSETERLTLELKEANASLDKKVEARTLELRNQEQSRRNMMLNTFHDLRSPLFILKGCVDMILVKPSLATEKLPIMKERLDFAIHLTEQLFLVAKLEEHQILFVEDFYDICEVLRNQVKSGRILAEPKRIRLQDDIPGHIELIGDSARIGEAIQNLVANAVQYTPAGGTVTVKLQETPDTVILTFTDTGRGIPQEDAEKVFSRFFRVESTSHSASTGLGLSIAREIIEQHNGNISVSSELNVGTCFTVTLPKE